MTTNTNVTGRTPPAGALDQFAMERIEQLPPGLKLEPTVLQWARQHGRIAKQAALIDRSGFIWWTSIQPRHTVDEATNEAINAIEAYEAHR